MSADDHALPTGRFAAGGLCQACAEPWPCPTRRIHTALQRMDAAALARTADLLDHPTTDPITATAGTAAGPPGTPGGAQ